MNVWEAHEFFETHHVDVDFLSTELSLKTHYFSVEARFQDKDGVPRVINLYYPHNGITPAIHVFVFCSLANTIAEQLNDV